MDVLRFYENLTPEQVAEFNKRLLDDMEIIREEVTAETKSETKENYQMVNKDAILEKHAREAADEIEAAEQNESEAGQLTAKLAGLSDKLNKVHKNPAIYKTDEIEKLAAEHESVYQKLVEMGKAKPDQKFEINKTQRIYMNADGEMELF